jgi:CelD/BcsL family acetyltransferase involved in cellulose biosynthesis
MQLGLYMDRVYYSPKVAYDEAFAKFSPGHLLVRHIVADLFKERAKSFEFLGPRAFWKAVWAADCVEHSNSYIFRPGVRGRCLHALTMRFAKGLRDLKYKIRGDPQRLVVD